MPKIKNTPCNEASATAVADVPEKTPLPKTEPATAPDFPDIPASPLDIDPDLIEDFGRESTWLSRAAENIFCKLADGIELSDDELAILRRVGPQVVPRDGGRSARAFEHWKNTEASRIKIVRKLQAQAGTGQERQAAIDSAEKAKATFSTRSKEIDEIIAELQVERAKLQQAANIARAENDRRQTAVQRLREKSVLPSYVVDRLQQTKKRWAGGDGHRLEAARNRLKILTGLSSLDVSERNMVTGGYSGGQDLETVKSYIGGCLDLGPDANSRLRAFGMLHESKHPPYGTTTEVIPNNLDRAKWRHYLETEVASEIKTLQKEIDRLEKLETEHNAASAMVDYYVPE